MSNAQQQISIPAQNRLLSSDKNDFDKFPICFYVALAITGLYLLCILLLRAQKWVSRSVSVVSAPEKPAAIADGPPLSTGELSGDHNTRKSLPEIRSIAPSPTSRDSAPQEEAKTPTQEAESRAKIQLSSKSSSADINDIKGRIRPSNLADTLETNQENANVNSNFPDLPQSARCLTMSKETAVVLPESEPASSFCEHFMLNHSATRLCVPQEKAYKYTRITKSLALSNLYVTIIGMFLSSGIYLDIACTCEGDKIRYRYTTENYGLSLVAVPIIMAIAWLLVNKFAFDYLLSDEGPQLRVTSRRTSKKKRRMRQPEPSEEGFRISAVICIIAMLVIVVSGFIAIAVYSFKFEKKLSVIWLGAMIICLVLETVLFDAAFQIVSYILAIRANRAKPRSQRI